MHEIVNQTLYMYVSSGGWVIHEDRGQKNLYIYKLNRSSLTIVVSSDESLREALVYIEPAVSHARDGRWGGDGALGGEEGGGYRRLGAYSASYVDGLLVILQAEEKSTANVDSCCVACEVLGQTMCGLWGVVLNIVVCI